MNPEYQEAREKIAIKIHTIERTLLKIVYEVSFLNCSWEQLDKKTQNLYLKEADAFLNLKWEDGSKMIGMISKDQKLPNIPDFSYDKEEYQPYLKRGVINYSKMLADFRKLVEKE